MRSATYDVAAKFLRQCGNSITMLVQYNPDSKQITSSIFLRTSVHFRIKNFLFLQNMTETLFNTRLKMIVSVGPALQLHEIVHVRTDRR